MPPQPNETITVYVINASNKQFPFLVDKFDSISSLRQKIFYAEGTRPIESRLLFKGKRVDDENTINDYNMDDGSILELYTEQCGC